MPTIFFKFIAEAAAIEKQMVPMGQVTTIGYAGFQSAACLNSNAPNGVQNKNDKSRPVSSNAVAGTPWCVVWTGDNKVF